MKKIKMSELDQQRIAIFGAAFNPPTLGHKDAIEFLLTHQPAFDSIQLIPSYKHAFQKNMVSYQHRLNMLNGFIQDIDDPRVKMLAVEQELATDQRPVYTFQVLNYLQSTYFPQAQLTFVIGPDNQANWHKFHKAKEIADKWSVLVVPERVNIRSTYLRAALSNQQSAQQMTSPSVLDYILQHSLYAD